MNKIDNEQSFNAKALADYSKAEELTPERKEISEKIQIDVINKIEVGKIITRGNAYVRTYVLHIESCVARYKLLF